MVRLDGNLKTIKDRLENEEGVIGGDEEFLIHGWSCGGVVWRGGGGASSPWWARSVGWLGGLGGLGWFEDAIGHTG